MKSNFIPKLLIIGAVLIGLFALGRGLFYFDNDEVDTDLSLVGSQVAQVNDGLTPKETDLPSRLEIPKIEVEADVQRLGVTSTGNMAAPKNFTDASWYKYGTAPGFKGSAVMAAHVDNALGIPAVFYDLPKLEVGDDVYVIQEDGDRLHFKVIDKALYPYNKSPVEKIFNDKSGTYLNLITCQGEWVPEAKSAANRLVIYTKLVE
jgi:sortase A